MQDIINIMDMLFTSAKKYRIEADRIRYLSAAAADIRAGLVSAILSS